MADNTKADIKPSVEELSKPISSAETTTVEQPQPQQKFESSPNPIPPTQAPLPSDAPSTADSKDTPTTTGNNPTPAPATSTATATYRPTPNETADIYIPSYSRWFSWNEIHECEVRFLPEFFDGRSPSKSPRVYKYYRNTIIRRFRENPTRKITFTESRRTIIGDVASIRKVFDFLETWGLINYNPSGPKPTLKWEDKETKSSASAAIAGQSGDSGSGVNDVTVPKKRLCGGCKSVCSMSCFACTKLDLVLCARCYVRGNYRVGLLSTDFRRVEITEELKTDWTDKETLHLLEAIMHYGEDWKKVAEHVGGRSEKECVARFIKLPFGEQFVGPPDSAEADDDAEPGSLSSKRMRLSPLADASNPIMAQAAFLSAMVGVDIAEAAAQAAIRDLSEVSYGGIGTINGGVTRGESSVLSNGNTSADPIEEARTGAQLQLEKEEHDLERAISEIAEVQMTEIHAKILHFEEFDSQMEKERQQLQLIKNLLFVDQLTLLSHQTSVAEVGESLGENLKTE